MVRCIHCVGYVNGKCVLQNGVFAGKKVENPYEEISCPAYLDISTAMMLGMFDDTFWMM